MVAVTDHYHSLLHPCAHEFLLHAFVSGVPSKPCHHVLLQLPRPLQQSQRVAAVVDIVVLVVAVDDRVLAAVAVVAAVDDPVLVGPVVSDTSHAKPLWRFALPPATPPPCPSTLEPPL